MALPQPASVPILDELMEEIFLRLPTLNILTRASSMCATFYRIIKGRTFRHRFRALQWPTILSFMHATGLHPTQAPHASALA
uniref:F-box domain-containing protein n=1 Tax=Aegilops tauschii TaxID=37682 RepID=M8BA15_AEGTA